jgi:hypothetical protein
MSQELHMHKKAFTPDNAAMLLIDHQLGTMSWTHSNDINLVKQNAIILYLNGRDLAALEV